MMLSWAVAAGASCWPGQRASTPQFARSGVLSLEDIAPTPLDGITTRMVRNRRSLQREHSCGGFRVESVCQAIGCLDQLLFESTVVQARRPEPGEQSLEAVVQLVDANERRASAFVGSSSYSGGAHANNTLDCITIDANGRRLGLKDLLPLHVAKKQLASAQRVAAKGESKNKKSVCDAWASPRTLPPTLTYARYSLRSSSTPSRRPSDATQTPCSLTLPKQGYTVQEQSVLFEPKSGIVTLCARAPFPLAGTVMLLPVGLQ